jgi:hypothetical protein
MPLARLLSVPAAALSLTATAASALAEIAQLVARRLTTSGDTQETVEAVRDTAEAIRRDTVAAPHQARELAAAASGLAELSDGAEAKTALRGEEVAPAAPEPDSPRAHVPPPVKSPERNVHAQSFDAARITALPAKQAIAALENLSSTELSEVHEQELANRRRKTVLRAIEQHVLPPDPTVDEQTPEQAARSAAAMDTPDIVLPAETVYTSESPA